MRKSYFIIPLSFIVHLGIINSVLYLCTPDTFRHGYSVLYYNIAWLLVTYGINFYKNARKKGLLNNFKNYVRLFLVYGLVFFASFTFLGANTYANFYLFSVYLIICLFLVIFNIIFYFARKAYRKKAAPNKRVVVIGWDKNLKKIRRIFDNPEHDYEYVGFFDNKDSQSPTYLGKIATCYDYIFKENIDELYCIASQLSKDEIQHIMNIADNTMKRVRIIPDNKELFSRAMSIELYDNVPVLNLRASPLELEYANLVKRVFDVVFSLFVIVCVFSWLLPIVALLIKLDSKGPVFFKQLRHGVNTETFWCLKFRSMAKNKESDAKMASKNDMRITKVGRILRKTSIDELPQFFNVLMGDMSVVGPRPHMVVQTEEYQKSVDKYLVRHFLKPGITGLAQVKGYRGEVIQKSDILNRVRYDIFYMEKWSLKLDLRIIFFTVFNALKGEEKAY
ncbi:undecaprenyl-phosphate glucose phosphotransferase [Croceivirga sp. JEA036]|uniref:undecaprenyl-phosphate glucose phosphotransferase n=1 Tax=Croceivirga sp. JEA036 TaxID=2721162 RepID=UPI001438E469|nr:undecaprenyl-phosphate glucose phosphotransferase [Croceivirga sp. JEA036]NJB35382.1 undecaprenyl-phosphate glucose phosphotransferase [Croceivirga sp. JEA036]